MTNTATVRAVFDAYLAQDEDTADLTFRCPEELPASIERSPIALQDYSSAACLVSAWLSITVAAPGAPSVPL